MSRSTMATFALALGAVFTTLPAGAKSAPPNMTCEEFLALGESLQPRAVAWMDGYSKGKLTEQDVGEVDVDRQTASLVVLCTETPKETFWDKVKAHLPGGKKKVKPTKMTCQEFVDLDESVQPEVAYWLDGYNAATKTTEHVAGEVDLERDIGVVVVDCKAAPKESLWEKIKKKF